MAYTRILLACRALVAFRAIVLALDATPVASRQTVTLPQAVEKQLQKIA